MILDSHSEAHVQGAHYYHDPAYAAPQGSLVPFADPMTQSLVEKCSSWHVPYSLLETELRRQNVSDAFRLS